MNLNEAGGSTAKAAAAATADTTTLWRQRHSFVLPKATHSGEAGLSRHVSKAGPRTARVAITLTSKLRQVTEVQELLAASNTIR